MRQIVLQLFAISAMANKAATTEKKVIFPVRKLIDQPTSIVDVIGNAYSKEDRQGSGALARPRAMWRDSQRPRALPLHAWQSQHNRLED